MCTENGRVVGVGCCVSLNRWIVSSLWAGQFRHNLVSSGHTVAGEMIGTREG